MSQGNKKSASADLAKVHAFLMGSGTLEGVSFGERHPGYVGKYWWRKSLSDAIVGASLSQSSTPDPANSIHTFEFAEAFGALLRADRKIAKTGASTSPEWIAAYDALIAYIDNFVHVVQPGGAQSKPAGPACQGGNTQPVSVESPRPAEVDVEAERKLFEAWASSEQFDLRRPHKSYHNTCTSYAWQGWLAARTQADAGKADTESVQWWLAEVDQYGNATLVDGMHGDRAGADKAAFLFDSLGLTNGRELAVAKVELTAPRPSSKGVNMDAIQACNEARAANMRHEDDLTAAERLALPER